MARFRCASSGVSASGLWDSAASATPSPGARSHSACPSRASGAIRSAADHPFWRHARVLVSPHVSAVTTAFWERETALIVENIRRYLAGAPLTNVVDLEAGY